MNETNAKLLQFVIIFWFILGLFGLIFSSRIGTFFLNTAEASDFTQTDNPITVLWVIMTFQVTAEVPIWISVLLDIIVVLTIISIIMAVTNR